MHVPNLRIVNGTWNLIGQKNISQDNFPKLEHIKGDLHLALSGFTKLPHSLISIQGDVYITQEPESLVKDCLDKKRNGIIKGRIFLVGGKVLRKEDNSIDYEDKYELDY